MLPYEGVDGGTRFGLLSFASWRRISNGVAPKEVWLVVVVCRDDDDIDLVTEILTCRSASDDNVLVGDNIVFVRVLVVVMAVEPMGSEGGTSRCFAKVGAMPDMSCC